MKIVIGSNNNDKIKEIKAIFEDLEIEWKTAADFPFSFEVEETGETFEENARLKAKTICEKTGCVALSDDSGLCVDALLGAPGVYSKRFGGENTTDEKNNALLLEKLKGTKEEARAARFVSVCVLYFPSGEYLSARGECEGQIALSQSGSGGFGYDPLFYYPPLKKTFGELTDSEKNEVSHRKRALENLRNLLKDKT